MLTLAEVRQCLKFSDGTDAIVYSTVYRNAITHRPLKAYLVGELLTTRDESVWRVKAEWEEEAFAPLRNNEFAISTSMAHEFAPTEPRAIMEQLTNAYT